MRFPGCLLLISAILLLVTISISFFENSPVSKDISQRQPLKQLPSTQPTVHSAELAKLISQLDAKSVLQRRSAVRKLVSIGLPAREGLEKAFMNDDMVVQRTALRGLCCLQGIDPLVHLRKAMGSDNSIIRLVAVEELAKLKPRTPEVIELLTKAQNDSSPAVMEVACQTLWPFHRKNISLRNKVDYDYEVQVKQIIPLPKSGWRFNIDPNRCGQLQEWYTEKFDDSKWKSIEIESAWQKQGYDYIGVAWYRSTFILPPKPTHKAVDLHFKGVDENAWVWVNGIYLGDHAIGPSGWDQPFYLDVTKEIRWGQKNQITVRVMNTVDAGGIWKPVELEVLE